MNVENVYNRIIERALKEDRKKGCGVYYEKHHILPRCIGGTNDKSNLILLTAKEHYICHRLLTLMYPDNKKIAFAFWNMCRPSNEWHDRYIVSANGYAYARSHLSNTYKGRTAWNKGKKLTDEQLAKHATRKPDYAPWNKGKKTGPQSEVTKEKRRQKLKGKPRSEETKQKLKASWDRRRNII